MRGSEDSDGLSLRRLGIFDEVDAVLKVVVAVVRVKIIQGGGSLCLGATPELRPEVSQGPRQTNNEYI